MEQGNDPMRDVTVNEILIRYGYEMTVACPQPTPMICLLDAHEDNRPNIREPETVTSVPEVPMHTYRDSFGNICRRFVAPAGDFTIRSNGLLASTDQVDPADWSAPEIPVQDLPDEAIQFLIGSRYCETDKMSQLAWDTFGALTPGYSRVQAIVDWSKQRLRFDYQQARSTRTALDAFYEQVGVCRDFAHLAITLCRCLNIPARYVNGYLGDIRVPRQPFPHGFLGLDGGVSGRPVVDVRPAQQCPPRGAHRHRPRAGRGGCPADQLLRSALAEEVRGVDGRGLTAAAARGQPRAGFLANFSNSAVSATIRRS